MGSANFGGRYGGDIEGIEGLKDKSELKCQLLLLILTYLF